jgi:anti-sigma-K factor RskA
MVYTSRANIADLAQFYIREAPTGQWQLQDTIEAEKSVTLLFNKSGNRMVVQVQDMGIAKGRRLTVTLTPDGGTAGGL